MSVVFVLAVSACSTDDVEPAPSVVSQADDDAGVATTSEEAVDEVPSTEPLSQEASGTLSVRLEHNGVTRQAILYVPESYNAGGDAALMLNFHGFGDNAASFMGAADMRALAERDGFLVAYPQGTTLDGSPHWNAAPDWPDNKSDADDLGFVRALVAEIEGDYPFDSERLYASGFSNGGMMAFALACHASDLVAAVGVVSGQLLDGEGVCTPTHPTAVITLHGTDDFVLPYEGNAGGLSTQDALDFWVSFNQTATTPEVASENDGDISIERSIYSSGSGGVSVEHYRYEGGLHTWFQTGFEGSDASQLVWDFVARHDINGAR